MSFHRDLLKATEPDDVQMDASLREQNVITPLTVIVVATSTTMAKANVEMLIGKRRRRSVRKTRRKTT